MAFLNFTFLRGFFEQFKFSGIAQGWTLTVEECFYLSAPLLLLLLSKIKSHYVVLSMFLLAMIATGCLLVALLPHYYGLFDSYKFMFYRTFFGRSFEFVLGAALALVVQRHPDARRGCWLTALGVLWLLGSMIALRFIGSAQSSSIDTPLGIAVNKEVAGFGIRVTLVEPNGYHTEFSASSMVQSPALPAYDNLKAELGKLAGFQKDSMGSPQATVPAVLQLLASDNPPKRLFLGKVGYPLIQHIYADRLASWGAWQEVSAAAHR